MSKRVWSASYPGPIGLPWSAASVRASIELARRPLEWSVYVRVGYPADDDGPAWTPEDAGTEWALTATDDLRGVDEYDVLVASFETETIGEARAVFLALMKWAKGD